MKTYESGRLPRFLEFARQVETAHPEVSFRRGFLRSMYQLEVPNVRGRNLQIALGHDVVG